MGEFAETERIPPIDCRSHFNILLSSLFVFEVKFFLGTRRLIEEYQKEDDNSIDIMNFN